MDQSGIVWNGEEDEMLAKISLIAAKLCKMDFSEEEAFVHIRRNHWYQVSEQKLRQMVGAAFDQNVPGKQARQEQKGRDAILQMMHFLNSRYLFRYNTVMKCTEYRQNNSWIGDFIQLMSGFVHFQCTLEYTPQHYTWELLQKCYVSFCQLLNNRCSNTA